MAQNQTAETLPQPPPSQSQSQSQSQSESESGEKQDSAPELQRGSEIESAQEPLQETSYPRFGFLRQPDSQNFLSVSLGVGVNFSNSTYQKSIPFEFESVKLPAYALGIESRRGDFLLDADFKSLPAQVQSSEGHLNVYGWSYDHWWGSVGLGYLLDKTHEVYLKASYHYLPILFPTQVGVFSSEAAFEKVSAYGLGVGYKSEFLFFFTPLEVQADLYYLKLLASGYDLKYGLAWNFRLAKTYMWKGVKWGVAYDQLGHVLSASEKYTGQDYPFKSFVRLHQLMLIMEARLF